MAKPRYEVISGKLVGERQRWMSSAGDSVVLDIMDGDSSLSVKGKESLDPFIFRYRYSFFGTWSSYRNRNSGIETKQFLFFAYCLSGDLEKVSDLMDLLLGRGFPRDLACRCVAENVTREMVERNPYRLLTFSGCGFRRCDELWLALKKPPEKMKRQAICLAHQLSQADDGSIWKSDKQAQDGLKSAIPKGTNFARATELGIRAGIIRQSRTDDDGIESWDGDKLWYAEARKADMESSLAELVAEKLTERRRWPTIGAGPLSEHQAEIVTRSLSHNLGILTGGGGTGKTFTTAHIVSSIYATTGDDVLLVAPTGKAAVRMTEAMGGKFSARTIHSALGFRGDGWLNIDLAAEGYRHVIVDECSMIDLELMWRLFVAARGCSILLIGDPYQLPPVGPGAPFHDIIAAHPAVGELTETRRNSGSIVAAAGCIRHGVAFDEHLNLDGENLRHREMCDPQRTIRTMLEEIQRWVDDYGADPVWDCQVLAQVKQRSELSTKSLNLALQKRLNCNQPANGQTFAIGDKVINSANSWLTPACNYPQSDEAVTNDSDEIYVANGDMGKVVAIEKKYMVIELTNPIRNVMAPTWQTDADESDEDDTGSRFQLGYAITTHKSQGSQAKYVINIIDDYSGARRLLDRSMLYTMVTRAQTECVLIGPMRVMAAALRKNSIWMRKTFLREKLQRIASLV